MNYQKIKGKGYYLHIINNKEFHTVEFRIYFTQNVDKKRITYHNALTDIMTLKTKKYNTKQKLIKKCQDLYSLYPTSFASRYGNLLRTCFGLSSVYYEDVNKDNLLENILLLKEIIFNPLVSNSAFNEQDVLVEKKYLASETNTIIEEPRLYADVKLLKSLGKDENYTLTGFSDLEVLKEMNGQRLYEYYHEMLTDSRVDIFVSGNLHDVDAIKKAISHHFVFKNNNYSLDDAQIYHILKKEEPHIIQEVKNYQQSKLAIALKGYDLKKNERRYALAIFNEILGGGSTSLLMQNVREKNSLCYYVGSYSNSLDNILVINSGINKRNYAQTLSLIYQTIDDIRKGKFTKADLHKAKLEYLVTLEKILENHRSIIEYFYGMAIFKSDLFEVKKQKIKQVSKEDIIRVANKMNIDTVFFLEGDL